MSYARRRANHPSLLLWCGGNELYYGPSPDYPGPQKPVDLEHPCIAMLARVVTKEDPGRRFLTGSPSGPVDYALPENYGKGIHHDIHGPWGQGGAARDDVPGLGIIQREQRGNPEFCRQKLPDGLFALRHGFARALVVLPRRGNPADEPGGEQNVTDECRPDFHR